MLLCAMDKAPFNGNKNMKNKEKTLLFHFILPSLLSLQATTLITCLTDYSVKDLRDQW